MKRTRINAALVLCGAIGLWPLGCRGREADEPSPVEVVLRVDATPLDREAAPPGYAYSYAAMLKQVRPAVVSIYSQRAAGEDRGIVDHPALRRFFEDRDELPDQRTERGIGSGVIVSPAGYVLTNHHVVEGADFILVELADRRRVGAEIVGTDGPTDLAVLRLSGEADEAFPFVILADSGLVEVGDVVFALGNALGIGHAVTAGIVSARGRTGIGILGDHGYENFIQTDASMNVGNSGGPLVDARGRVVGINTAIASPGGGNVGVGFAIPINLARTVMRNLIEFGEVRRGYLGISLERAASGFAVEYGAPNRGPGSEPDGALVVGVVPDSPAARAGLAEGDSILELDGSEIRSANELRLKVSQTPPGSRVRLSVVRNQRRLEVSAVLGDLEAAKEIRIRRLVGGDGLLRGLTVVSLSPDLKKARGLADELEGLLVTDVDPDSAHGERFPVGAVIVRVNRRPATDLQTARNSLRAGGNLFLLFHDDTLHHVWVELEE